MNCWRCFDLPDNNTGQIDAADLREIVTALYERAGTTVGGTWRFDPTTTGDPDPSLFQFDTGAPGTATSIIFNVMDVEGEDMRALLMNASRFVMQQRNNASNWATFNATDAPLANASTVQIPVMLVQGGGDPLNASWQDILVYFTLGPVT